ncbi:MAG: histidine phosphatase family protein [Deinococcales bacterium]
MRYGETDWNVEQRIQGHSDAPLNPGTSVAQAKQLAKRISHEPFDHIYGPDLSRARHREIVFPKQNIQLDERRREIYLGNFEGRWLEQLSDAEKQTLRSWWYGPYDLKVGGGESADDLRFRVRSWLDDLPKEGRIVAFSHGGTIRSILQLFTGREAGWTFNFKNTGISRISFHEDVVRLDVVNDAAHLEFFAEEFLE